VGRQIQKLLSLPLLLFCILSVLLSCQSYPRYSNTPVVYDKPTSPDEPDDYDNKPPSQIDRVLMGRIIDDYLGTPYQNGGSSINGIDCSGLIRTMYYEYDGRSLPPDVRRMYRAGTIIERDELMFGDLLFFAFGTRGPNHAGMFIGNGRFVHASESRGVIISTLDETTYAQSYHGARRLY